MELTETIRKLLMQSVFLSMSDSFEQIPGQRVLLDIEVDGIRCLLIEPLPATPGQHPMILSPREQEVSRMVAKGYANKTIAAVLEISTWTVGTYVRRIFAKLGVGCRAAMVAKLQEVASGRLPSPER